MVEPQSNLSRTPAEQIPAGLTEKRRLFYMKILQINPVLSGLWHKSPYPSFPKISFTLNHQIIAYLKTNQMKKNMGIADRAIRILVAVIIAVLYFTKTEPVTGTVGMILLVIGGIFLLTSVISFCPLYTLLGVNTCKKD